MIKIKIEVNPLFQLQKELKDKTLLQGCEVAELTIGKKKRSIKIK